MEICFKKIGEDITLSELEIIWTALESESQNESFFISWFWISTWLREVNVNPFVLIAKEFNNVVALGLFYESKIRLGPFSKKAWWLNKTGTQVFDQVWIEYNDLLFSSKLSELQKSAIRQAAITQNNQEIQEVHFDLTESTSDFSRYKSSTIGYLTFLRDGEKEIDLLSTFSRNTRQQIKRSLKLLKEKGEVYLLTEDKGITFFEALCIKHREQWGKSLWGSGFDNPNFLAFHKALHNGVNTKVLALSINGELLAFGYYFLYKNRVSFYLSAIDKFDDNRIKVGLAFHYLAMTHFQKQGFEIYDFLGGVARYKKSMSNRSYQLHSWYLERKNLFSICKNSLISLKNRYFMDKK